MNLENKDKKNKIILFLKKIFRIFITIIIILLLLLLINGQRQYYLEIKNYKEEFSKPMEEVFENIKKNFSKNKYLKEENLVINGEKVFVYDTKDNIKDVNNILIMLPNFVGKAPYIFGDFGCNEQKKTCYGIFSYTKGKNNKLSPFTEELSNNGKDRIIEFNYNREFNYKEIVLNYLKNNDIPKNKPIKIYGQSMGGKVAIYIAYILLKEGYNIKKIIINSSPLDWEDIKMIKYLKNQNNHSLGVIAKISKYIPYRLALDNLVSGEDNSLITKEETKLMWRTLVYDMQNDNIPKKVAFLRDKSYIEKLSYIKQKRIKIEILESIPLEINKEIENKKNNLRNDGLIISSFINKIEKIIGKNNIRYIPVYDVYHSQVAERNLIYAKYYSNIE